MNEKGYCYEFLPEHSRLFPNDEIFLATCTFNDKGCTWLLPENLIDDFKSKFLRVTYSELLDDEKIWIYQRWINDIIGFSQPVIQWRTAVSLHWPENKEFKSSGENNYIYAKGLNELNLKVKKDHYFKIYKSYPHVSAAVIDDRIVSICFSTETGPLSIETKKKYRRKGYGSIVLAKYIEVYKKKMTNILCPTDLNNKASIGTAKKVGFEQREFMYWITIPPYARNSIPLRIETDLIKISFPDEENR